MQCCYELCLWNVELKLITCNKILLLLSPEVRVLGRANECRNLLSFYGIIILVAVQSLDLGDLCLSVCLYVLVCWFVGSEWRCGHRRGFVHEFLRTCMRVCMCVVKPYYKCKIYFTLYWSYPFLCLDRATDRRNFLTGNRSWAENNY